MLFEIVVLLLIRRHNNNNLNNLKGYRNTPTKSLQLHCACGMSFFTDGVVIFRLIFPAKTNLSSQLELMRVDESDGEPFSQTRARVDESLSRVSRANKRESLGKPFLT